MVEILVFPYKVFAGKHLSKASKLVMVSMRSWQTGHLGSLLYVLSPHSDWVGWSTSLS